jgi:hypothetical protein
MAISRTTLYHIHDSTLKASIAWSPLICVWRFGVVLRVGGVHFHGYSWGEVASWVFASSLALLAPRGMFPEGLLFGGPVQMARRLSTQQAAQVHWGSIGEWWRSGGRVMGNRFCGWYMEKEE